MTPNDLTFNSGKSQTKILEDQAPVKRPRSPQYPSLSLPECVDRVGKLYKKVGDSEVARSLVLTGLGFSGANGSSLSALSATRKFDLVRKNGDGYRVSDLAKRILDAPSTGERMRALKSAVRKPNVFAELIGAFGGREAGDDELKRYLADAGYSIAGLAVAVTSFRESIKFVESTAQRPQSSATASPSFGQEPFRVSILSGRIEVSGTLLDGASIDRLVEALKAAKNVLKR